MKSEKLKIYSRRFFPNIPTQDFNFLDYIAKEMLAPVAPPVVKMLQDSNFDKFNVWSAYVELNENVNPLIDGLKEGGSTVTLGFKYELSAIYLAVRKMKSVMNGTPRMAPRQVVARLMAGSARQPTLGQPTKRAYLHVSGGLLNHSEEWTSRIERLMETHFKDLSTNEKFRQGGVSLVGDTGSTDQQKSLLTFPCPAAGCSVSILMSWTAAYPSKFRMDTLYRHLLMHIV